jgi:YcxB-like protein
VQLKYEITLPEFMEMAWLRHRSSIRWIIGICVGVVGLLMGAVFYVDANPVVGMILIAFSIFLLLMQFVIPSLVFRRMYQRNPRMFGMRTVNINDTGIVADHQLGHTESAWSMYEKFRETQKLFLLYQTTDVIGILPKRAFADVADIEQFRTLIASKVRQG